jgi:hypothetical protein
MKLLIFFLLTSLSSFASNCVPYVPLSRAEAIASITAYEQLAEIPMKLCKDFPEEECICAEGDVSASKIETRFEMNPETGMVERQYKVLVPDLDKKAQFEAAKAAKEAAEEQYIADKMANCQALKGLGSAIENIESAVPSTASTIAQIRAEINAKNTILGNLLKKVKGCLK